MQRNKKLIISVAIVLVMLAVVGVVSACSYFFTLPTNGIGYWTKQKETSVVIITGVTEHIICDNGLLHIEFDVTNTDGNVKNVELWVYFKSSSGTVLEEKYFALGNMNAHQTIHESFDQLFTPASQLDQLAHEDFSVHYSR